MRVLASPGVSQNIRDYKIMSAKSNKKLRAAAISSFLASGAVAGSFIGGEPAQAQFIGTESQSRVSVAITNFLATNVTNSFSSEIVFPQSNIAPTGVVNVQLTYTTIAASDPTAVAITQANVTAAQTAITADTVEASTARAVDAATGASRFGDVVGIVNAWKSSLD